MKYRGIGEPALPGAFLELRYPCGADAANPTYVVTSA